MPRELSEPLVSGASSKYIHSKNDVKISIYDGHDYTNDVASHRIR
jgi:hypothetical protein